MKNEEKKELNNKELKQISGGRTITTYIDTVQEDGASIGGKDPYDNTQHQQEK